jgi:hypothetical protein
MEKYAGHKNAGNPLTDGENIIYNIHLTTVTLQAEVT